MDALVWPAVPRHRDSLPIRPRDRALHEVEQYLGVEGAIASYGHGRIVAGFFRDPYDAPMQKPAQRAMPQQHPMNRREQLNGGIVAPDVRALMRQYGVQLCDIPLAPIAGQHDGRAYDA